MHAPSREDPARANSAQRRHDAAEAEGGVEQPDRADVRPEDLDDEGGRQDDHAAGDAVWARTSGRSRRAGRSSGAAPQAGPGSRVPRAPARRASAARARGQRGRPGEQDAGDGEGQPGALEGEQQPGQRRAGEQPHRLDRARQDVGGGEVGRVVHELGQHRGLRRPEDQTATATTAVSATTGRAPTPPPPRRRSRPRSRGRHRAAPRRPVDQGADRGAERPLQRSADEDREPDRRAAPGVVRDDGQADGRRPSDDVIAPSPGHLHAEHAGSRTTCRAAEERDRRRPAEAAARRERAHAAARP